MQQDTPSQPALTLPHNSEIEESLLGSLLIDPRPETFRAVRLILADGASEFFIHRNGWLFDAFERMVKRGATPDIITLSHELNTDGKLDEFGGSSRLVQLAASTVSSLNFEEYARIVHACHVRRKSIAVANEQASEAYNLSMSVDELLGNVATRSNALARSLVSEHGKDISEVVTLAEQAATARGESGNMGIPTPIPDLNLLLGGGWQDGDLIEIACRPGAGKTALLMQAARHAARHRVGNMMVGKHVAIFSLEMSAEQLIYRMEAQETGISSQLIRTGSIPAENYPEYTAAVELFHSLSIHIDDTPAVSPEYVIGKCEILRATVGLDLIILDYLTLMSTPGRRFSKTVEQVDFLARELKNVARIFNVPVLTAQQMNRSIETRGMAAKPRLSDLNEGGEKDADVVIFINHVKGDDERTILASSLDLVKHRSGPTDDVPVVWRPQTTKFEPAYRGPLAGD